jgi:hypothetical protein
MYYYSMFVALILAFSIGAEGMGEEGGSCVGLFYCVYSKLLTVIVPFLSVISARHPNSKPKVLTCGFFTIYPLIPKCQQCFQ